MSGGEAGGEVVGVAGGGVVGGGVVGGAEPRGAGLAGTVREAGFAGLPAALLPAKPQEATATLVAIPTNADKRPARRSPVTQLL